MNLTQIWFNWYFCLSEVLSSIFYVELKCCLELVTKTIDFIQAIF